VGLDLSTAGHRSGRRAHLFPLGPCAADRGGAKRLARGL